MNVNPFAAVSDYPSMLNKIAVFVFVAALILLQVLRQQFPAVDAFLALGPSIPIFGLQVSTGMFLAAFVIAFLSRALKFHDRLSDLFGIRARFDVSSVLLPLASASGGLATVQTVRKLKAERKKLMGETFYKYVSSTPGKAQIDPHHITMAMDQWTWYWIVLEVSALITLVGLAFLVTDRTMLAAAFLLLVLCLQWLLLAIRKQCEEYALQEVELILQDAARQNAIRGAFSAL